MYALEIARRALLERLTAIDPHIEQVVTLRTIAGMATYFLQLAFWLTASLLLGAFCASLAATEGGGLRDGTWGRKVRN